MYAIAFDLKIDELKKHYGDPYNGAYAEIEKELGVLGFEWKQGSLYVMKDDTNSISILNKAINRLAKISWFRNSVRDIRAFKVEDWSDITDNIKNFD
jgi:virulence-associated protein VapD